MEESLQRLLVETLRGCNAYNIPTCIAYGTLLAHARNQVIIPHDDDIDILVHERHRERVEAWAKAVNKVKNGALRLVPRKRMVRLIYRDPMSPRIVRGDIFYFCRRSDPACPDKRVAFVYQENNSFPWESMWPLLPVTVCGVATHVPQNVSLWLTTQYGPTYMTPQKGAKGRFSLWTYVKLGCRRPGERIATLWHEFRLLFPREAMLTAGGIVPLLVVVLACCLYIGWLRRRLRTSSAAACAVRI
jgi:hypothetical protein